MLMFSLETMAGKWQYTLHDCAYVCNEIGNTLTALGPATLFAIFMEVFMKSKSVAGKFFVSFHRKLII